MTPSICLIASEPDVAAALKSILGKTSLACWSANSVESFAGAAERRDTLCLVVALPGIEGLELLERLRALGVETPAVLVADRSVPLPAKRLLDACVLDTIDMPIQPRELLGWIECVCVTRMVLSRETLLQSQTRRRVSAALPLLDVA